MIHIFKIIQIFILFFPLRIEYLCRKAWFMPIREVLRKPLPHLFETPAEISSLAADGRDKAQVYQTPLHVLPDIPALFLSAVPLLQLDSDPLLPDQHHPHCTCRGNPWGLWLRCRIRLSTSGGRPEMLHFL